MKKKKSGSKIKVMSRKAAALLALHSNNHSNCTYWMELRVSPMIFMCFVSGSWLRRRKLTVQLFLLCVR